jgi:hypothetical protein
VTFSTNSPVAGDDVTGTINFMGVSGPFSFTVTFSNGVTPLTQIVTAPSGATSASFTFTIDPFLLADDPDGKDINVSVSATDGNGSMGYVNGSLAISAIPNQSPDVDENNNGNGGNPDPEPDPGPHVETDEERIGRIQHVLRQDEYGYLSVDIADLLWYDHYWATHTPEQHAADQFPVAGASLIETADFEAPNIMRVTFKPDDGTPGHFQMWTESQQAWGATTNAPDELTREVKLHFALVGPRLDSLPVTIHAFKSMLTEDLVVHVPVPKLTLDATSSGATAHVTVGGDDGEGEFGQTGFGSSEMQLYGARVTHSEYTAPGQRDLELRFVPRGPQVPALLVVGHSPFWRYRSKLVEFPGLPVKGWSYDYGTSVLHVDARDSGVQLGLTLPGGVHMDAPAGGNADFAVPKADASYSAVLNVLDGAEAVDYDIRLGNAAASIPLDTLRAWPLASHVGAGQPVRIVVAGGVTAQPFEYMTGCRVTATAGSGMHYVRKSFNVGAPGGEIDSVDGGWDAMRFEDFLLAPDVFMTKIPYGSTDTIDFNLTPLQGEDIFFEGELFNFEVSFDNPGTYTLGFEKFHDPAARTYYQDANLAPDHYWGDISNAETPGLPSPVIQVD